MYNVLATAYSSQCKDVCNKLECSFESGQPHHGSCHSDMQQFLTNLAQAFFGATTSLKSMHRKSEQNILAPFNLITLI